MNESNLTLWAETDEIIKRVSNIGAVERALFSQGLLSGEKLCEIQAAGSRERRMVELYWSLGERGQQGAELPHDLGDQDT
ncbi:hypothetical protein GN956_G23422 [Arapaima gigas]